MQKKLYQFTLLVTVIAVVITSAVSVTAVFADDGGTSGEPTEPVLDEAPPEGGETPPEGEPAPVEAEEVLPEEEPAPVETVGEILEQIPEDTELVVVTEEGTEPLATMEAAETILQSDPIWCPGIETPTTPGNSCTISYTTVTELINNLGDIPARASSISPALTQTTTLSLITMTPIWLAWGI